MAKKWNLNNNEYDELFNYLSKFIFLVCHSLSYDYHIAGTAAILFRRIYQKYPTIKEVNNDKNFNDDPRLIAIVCIFITAKSKDMNISTVNAFLNKIKKSHDPKFKYNQDDITRSELFCVKILSFDLNVFLPFEACSDLLMECNALHILRDCWKLLLMTLKTNIYLQYPPYLIAMATIYIICNQNHTNIDFEIFLRKIDIPFENITEVTKIIIKKLFVNDNNNNKKYKNIPIQTLKRIDLFYTKHIKQNIVSNRK